MKKEEGSGGGEDGRRRGVKLVMPMCTDVQQFYHSLRHTIHTALLPPFPLSLSLSLSISLSLSLHLSLALALALASELRRMVYTGTPQARPRDPVLMSLNKTKKHGAGT